jgi:hypothetical protein
MEKQLRTLIYRTGTWRWQAGLIMSWSNTPNPALKPTVNAFGETPSVRFAHFGSAELGRWTT